jgi:hypothetical protein
VGAVVREHLDRLESGGPPNDHRIFMGEQDERRRALFETLAQLIESSPAIAGAIEGAL